MPPCTREGPGLKAQSSKPKPKLSFTNVADAFTTCIAYLIGLDRLQHSKTIFNSYFDSCVEHHNPENVDYARPFQDVQRLLIIQVMKAPI